MSQPLVAVEIRFWYSRTANKGYSNRPSTANRTTHRIELTEISTQQ